MLRVSARGSGHRRNTIEENIGLTLNIPIFNKRSTKTAVNLAKLNIENAQLNYENVQKELLEIGRDGLSGCGIGAEPFPFGPGESDPTELSFELTSGAVFPESKNTVELMTEKTTCWLPSSSWDTSQIYGDPESAIVEFLSGIEISIQ